jgi:D-arabinose 1-dehydrogenase-like Zn-dependent alcohol dehydrogenase
MATGRAVVIKEYLKPFVIEEFDVPDPEPGAILLKISQAGICGPDLHTWRGDRATSLLPLMMEMLVKNQDRVPYHKIVSNRYPLDQVNEAFEDAEWNERQTQVSRGMLAP